MESLRFWKMHGIGNDFVVADGRERPGVNWSGLAREICDRHFGVGADGLLVVDESRWADVAMRMFNPDGTPDVCGNGLRCVARWCLERSLGSADGAITIHTLAGVRHGTMSTNAAGACEVTVDMGAPRFAPADIPMLGNRDRAVAETLEVGGEELAFTALSTGSTHCVVFVDELPGDERFNRLSPLVERHRIFPDRTSLMWACVEAPGRIRLRIWERGVGETLGCGTGACAAAVAGQLRGLVGQEVTVASGGGEVRIRWTEGGPVVQTGPAEYVYEALYPL